MQLNEELKIMFNDGVDGVHFIPIKNNGIDIKGFLYDKKSKYDKQELGHVYHIVIYQCTPNGKIYSLDNFDAILIDPSVYITNLINCDFFGVVSKKTKQSHKFIKTLLKQLKPFYEKT